MGFAVWVEYEVSPGHVHMVTCADNILQEDMRLVLSGIEGYGEELADQVLRCSPDRHGGHGRKHSHNDAKLAFETAVFQLLTTDYEAEWEEIQRKQRVFQKWGGQVPAAVLQPCHDDPKQWEAIIPHREGDPYIYKLRKGILEDIMDPRESSSPNEYGLGWSLKQRRN